MSNLKQLRVTFFEPDFDLKMQEIANLAVPMSALPQPIVFHVSGANWYLRSLKKVISMPYSMIIFGAGTHDLNKSLNVEVEIELDLRKQKQDGQIIFTS
jgi:hypothetical protein